MRILRPNQTFSALRTACSARLQRMSSFQVEWKRASGMQRELQPSRYNGGLRVSILVVRQIDGHCAYQKVPLGYRAKSPNGKKPFRRQSDHKKPIGHAAWQEISRPGLCADVAQGFFLLSRSLRTLRPGRGRANVY